ncbi:hypothetical protein HYW54_02000 [Candidatus Gottesmanbacteria bacterium]|nr:hypothetical protein [Candidatus Gottesmanbacteria bacterium]
MNQTPQTDVPSLTNPIPNASIPPNPQTPITPLPSSTPPHNETKPDEDIISLHPDPLPQDIISLKNLGLNKITAELKKRATFILGGSLALFDNTTCDVDGVIPVSLNEIKMKLDDVKWANQIVFTIQEYPRAFTKEEKEHKENIERAAQTLNISDNLQPTYDSAVRLYFLLNMSAENPDLTSSQADIVNIFKYLNIPPPQTQSETISTIKAFFAGLEFGNISSSTFEQYYWATIAHQQALNDLPKRKEQGKIQYDEALKYQKEAIEVLAKNKETALNEKYTTLKEVEDFISNYIKPDPVKIGHLLEQGDEEGLKKILSPLSRLPENFSENFPLFATAIQWNFLNSNVPEGETPPSLRVYIKIARTLSGDPAIKVDGYREVTEQS